MRLYEIEIYDNIPKPFTYLWLGTVELIYIKRHGYTLLENGSKIVFDIDYNNFKKSTLIKFFNSEEYKDIIELISKIKTELREETINTILE